MEFVLFTLLFGAVWLLWTRIRELEQHVERLERDMRAKLKAAEVAAPARTPEPAVIRDDLLKQVVASDPLPKATPSPVAPPPPQPVPQTWTPPPARPQPVVQQDSLLVRLVKDYFTGGNLVVRVGIIVLFFGVSFLLKYAAEHTQLSMQMRLSGVAFGAFALFALGWKLRVRRRGFALALQGGAIGVLYLTLFAALRLYQLLPPGPTFLLMAALGVISCLLAVKQDSLALTMLGATGGFLAPVLASTGQGSHVVLFGYYALLNAFIVVQAWFKAWRPLNLLAFVFTFGVGTAWGVMRYEPAQFATTEPFLLFFFLAFIAIAVLFAFRAAPQLTHYVDGTLVFGNPAVAMALQMELVRDFQHGRAWSATGAGILYLALSAWLHRAQRETLRLLQEAFLAIGIAFLTLAVPLWMNDTWTAATWALEGAAAFWIGLRQGRRLSVIAGVVLQLAAAVAYVLRSDVAAATYPVIHAAYMGALLLSVAGLFSACVASRPHSLLKEAGLMPSHLLLVWGLAWWFYATGRELQEFVSAEWLSGAYLGLFAVTAFACAALTRPLTWPALRAPALMLLPVMVCAALVWQAQQLHPFSQGGWLAWPAAFAVLWLTLRWHEASLQARVAATWQGGALWLLAWLASSELGWRVGEIAAVGTVWAAASWAIVPGLMLAGLTGGLVERWWPLRNHQRDFRSWVAGGFVAFLLGWSLWINVESDGTATPLPFLPLLNPLDVAVGLALFVVARWLTMVWRTVPELFEKEVQRWTIAALGAVTFIWLNGSLLRTMHEVRGLPYQFDALMVDTAVQATLSIFWTLLALGAMLWANRNALRVLWFTGAALMAVVVAKLFLVDLVRVGTLPRIVSFLVVGGLMLVIGYFSPLPPRQKDAAA